jgi:hypothetical protein
MGREPMVSRALVRRLVRSALCLMVAASACTSVAVASPRAIVLGHPRFVRVASAGLVFAAGDYQLVSVDQTGGGGVLTDLKTSSRTRIDAPTGCGDFLMSASALLFKCDGSATSAFQLYSFRSRTARPISFPGEPEALGTRWVEVAEYSDQTEHPAIRHAYENLMTGAVVADPRRAGGDVTVDLNASGLTVRACDPLTVPRASEVPTITAPGTLTILGWFGLGVGHYPSISAHGTATVLQRCGSRTGHAIDRRGGRLVASSSLILWQAAPDRLSGYALPDLRPIRVDLSSRLAVWTADLSLNNRKLYFEGKDGTWSLDLSTIRRARSR